MDHHIDQPSSNVPTHSDELQLDLLTQQNKRLTRKILPFEVKHYQHQYVLNILLNTAKRPKYPYFAAEQQPLLSLAENASQVSRTAFISSLVIFGFIFHIYGAQLTKGSVLFIRDPITNTYTSLMDDTFF